MQPTKFQMWETGFCIHKNVIHSFEVIGMKPCDFRKKYTIYQLAVGRDEVIEADDFSVPVFKTELEAMQALIESKEKLIQREETSLARLRESVKDKKKEEK